MTHAAGEASKDDSPILRAAIALAPQVHAEREEIERGAWGGPELDPPTQFRVLEALAMSDGSVGWCATIHAGRRAHGDDACLSARLSVRRYGRLRDILTMNQHVVATLRSYEMAGRILLGLEPLRWLF
jgi:hypothetical protein